MVDSQSSLREEIVMKDFEIKQFSKNQILSRELPMRNKLLDMLVRAYNLTPEQAAEDPQKLLEIDYGHIDTALIAMDESGNPIGSLGLVDLNQHHERHAPFWRQLSSSSRKLHDILLSSGPLLSVRGVVADPEFRRMHVGSRLFQQAEALLRPSAILGETKSVAILKLRRKYLDGRTFYADTEITPGREVDRSLIHIPIRDAILSALPQMIGEYLVETDKETGIAFVTPAYLEADIPDVTNEDEIIKTAFAPVIKAQQTTDLDPNPTTAVAPVITIKSSILDSISL